jgi:2-C-methyl-D-erythritol 4-phosphate cytidylyltransferase
MNIAVIVAAGSGSRFGSATPKQFVEILGKPLLVHTVERFESCPLIDEIVLVLPAAEVENFRKTAEKFNLKKVVKIAAGGKTRAESVFNGLNSIDKNAAEIVAVHDGARPLVSPEEITRTIEKAREIGAACLVADVTDTIKEVSNGKIIGTIERAKLRRALTPQAFRYEILQKAFAENDLNDAAAATDECFLVEKLGFEIAAVEGNARNIKITAPEDFLLAETLLRNFEG